jgi:Fe-S-cluster-containing hydrogenase component 2
MVAPTTNRNCINVGARIERPWLTQSFVKKKKGVLKLKKLVADASLCIGCGACEKACAKAYYKVEDREKSAIRVTAQEGGGFSIAVCDQCGVCRDMCSIMALKQMDNGVVRLDKKTCVGCLICVGECLRDYMFYHDELPTPFKCVACGICAKACESGALSIVTV